MNKKWLVVGFVFICLILTGAGFGSGYQYRQTEIDALKLRVKSQTGEIKKWQTSSEEWQTSSEDWFRVLVKTEGEYKDLQKNYFDVLEYSSNLTAEKQQYYNNWQELLRNPIEKEWGYLTPKNFDNVTELREFLDSSILLIFTGDCDDYAYALQEMGYIAGYYISVQLIMTNQGTWHMRNTAKVGNELWYIEPQTLKCWKACDLD